jgi:beta-lactamase class A
VRLLLGPIALLAISCAALPTSERPGAASRGVELLRAMDRGEARTPLTEGLQGVFPHGLEGFAQEWRSSHGALLDAREAGREGDTLLVDAVYAHSPFAERLKLTFDDRGRLAGFWYLGAGSGVMDAPSLERAFAALPGQVSAFAQAAEHRELTFGHRADVPQPVASQYKTLLLARACGEVGRGTRTLDDRLILSASQKGLPSCVLCQFDGGLQPTLRDVLHLLVASSDNTAADLLREALTVDGVTRFAEQNGVAHVPALISTRGLFALECGLGSLHSQAISQRAASLAQLSAAGLLAAADAAAREGFAEGPAGFERRCEAGGSDGDARNAIAHVADWNLRADELVALYTSAQLGQLDTRAASECFVTFMGHGGPGPISLGGRYLSAGAKNGLEADVRSLGLLVQTDRGPIAVSLSAMQLPDAQADRMLPLLSEGARALVEHLYAQLPARSEP